MGKSTKTKRKKPFVRITMAACLLSSLLFFTTVDLKFFDLFLRALPSLTENENIIVLTLDDDSINFAGGFPFRREVMADVVVLLKELGVKTIAFDLSYLDESPYRLDPVTAGREFNQQLHSGMAMIEEAAVAVIDGIQDTTRGEDRELFKQDIAGILETVQGDIQNTFAVLTKDVDEYFAQSIAFSGNTWLTLTMFRQQDILSEDGVIAGNEAADSYLAQYVAIDNVTDLGDSKTPEMAGVMPAIQKLLSRAQGAGFVNAYPDADGLRRRIHLLLKYNGDYYGNLSLVSMQEMLEFSSIEVSDDAITLVNDNGERMRVPRSADGSMIIKWPKKAFLDYRYISLIKLIQHTIIEPVFAQNIALMNDSGFFTFWDGDVSPWDYYVYADDIKNAAFAENAGADSEWLAARDGFFNTVELFLNGGYEDNILDAVGDDMETAEFVKELFSNTRLQYERLAEIRTEMSVLQNSWCVIGSDATSMTDIGINTFEERYPNVGTYYAAANMLQSGEFLAEAPWFVSAIIALLFSLAIAFLISRSGTHVSIITGLSSMVVLSAGSLIFFMITKIYPGFAVPLTATTLTFIALMVSRFLTESNEKAFLHNAFSRYLAPEIITEIINNPDKLNLGGEKREMTAIFTDIQGFSTFSEQLDPVQLVRLLNRYLTAMSNIIMENLGTIDKYEGDAIIAFFGAPIFREDHAALACRSALAMKKAETELNKVFLEEKLAPVPIFTRIGINTGDMVVGNMGAENKMDYTIMGNAVNLAARLEGVNKQYQTGGILISEYTHAKIGDEFICRRLDRVRVVGVKTPLRLYELLAINNEQAMSGIKDAADNWETSIDLYEQKQFERAEKLFNDIFAKNPDDRTAALYAKRCAGYKNNPPPADWDGINNLTEK